MGMHAEAHARLLGALEALPDRHSSDAAALLCELAADGVWGTDWRALRDRAAAACEVSHAAGERQLEATAQALLAFGEYAVGDPGAGMAPLDAAAALVDASSDSALAERLDATYYLAWTEYYLERCEDAIRHADRGLALARATGRGQFFAPTLTAKAAALRVLGRLDEAAEAAQEALDSARLAGHDQVVGFALHLRSWVATAQGDLDLALRAGRDGLAISRRLGQSVLSSAGGWILGEALLEAGDPSRLRGRRAGGCRRPRRRPPAARPAVLCLAPARPRGRPARQPGRGAGLDRTAGRGIAVAGCEQPADGAGRGRPRARAAARRRPCGRRSRGIRLGRSGGARRCPPRRVAVTAARRPRDCRRRRARAGDRAARAGASRVRALRRLPLPRPRRPRPAPARPARRLRRPPRAPAARESPASASASGGSPSSSAAGETNKQIASELSISAKTVERHLSNSFRKLHVASRAQLAALLASYSPPPEPVSASPPPPD